MIADLFSGARGWEAASKVDAVGFEHDRDACRTSAAAGLLTVRCDLFDYPMPTVDLEGLIASPPCQPFSRAGKRSGIDELQSVVAHVDRCADGWHEPEAPWRRDPRIGLVVEPLRWALAKVPEWCAWEQVPDVLPVWEACARVLRAQGWSVWTGTLNAEQYGVPQTRERAFLIASRSRVAQPPTPTHQEYRSGVPALTVESVDLFGDTLLPWVSMADALGWGVERPCWTITNGGTETGGAEPIANAANRRALRASNDRPNACVRHEDEPAPTVAFGHAGPEWVVRTGANSMVTGRSGSRAGDGDVLPYERPVTDPAPTVDAKAGGAWTVLNTGRAWKPGGTRADAQCIPTDRPAPTVDGEHSGAGRWWWQERPATTVVNDARVFGPHSGESHSANRVKVTLEDALTLQSFPADWPLQGTKTSKFRQVGNAVPPLLAAAVLDTVAPRR